MNGVSPECSWRLNELYANHLDHVEALTSIISAIIISPIDSQKTQFDLLNLEWSPSTVQLYWALWGMQRWSFYPVKNHKDALLCFLASYFG